MQMKPRIYAPIEEVLKSGEGIDTGTYVALYDIPVRRIKFKYSKMLKNKYFGINSLGQIQLTYSKKDNKFFLVLQVTFRLPYYKKNANIKIYLPQAELKDLINMRECLRPIKKGLVYSNVRKLSPLTQKQDLELKAKMRGEREERIKAKRDKLSKKSVEHTGARAQKRIIL